MIRPIFFPMQLIYRSELTEGSTYPGDVLSCHTETAHPVSKSYEVSIGITEQLKLASDTENAIFSALRLAFISCCILSAGDNFVTD